MKRKIIYLLLCIVAAGILFRTGVFSPQQVIFGNTSITKPKFYYLDSQSSFVNTSFKKLSCGLDISCIKVLDLPSLESKKDFDLHLFYKNILNDFIDVSITKLYDVNHDVLMASMGNDKVKLGACYVIKNNNLEDYIVKAVKDNYSISLHSSKKELNNEILKEICEEKVFSSAS